MVESVAESAVRKFDAFYAGLDADEQEVIALIVSSSLQRAARAQAERDWLAEGEFLLELISAENSPNLVGNIGTYVAGQLAPNRSEKRPLE
jgi:hypothetical protein